jgi:hypothetical protein
MLAITLALGRRGRGSSPQLAAGPGFSSQGKGNRKRGTRSRRSPGARRGAREGESEVLVATEVREMVEPQAVAVAGPELTAVTELREMAGSRGASYCT